jgi:hypothetical protein
MKKPRPLSMTVHCGIRVLSSGAFWTCDTQISGDKRGPAAEPAYDCSERCKLIASATRSIVMAFDSSCHGVRRWETETLQRDRKDTSSNVANSGGVLVAAPGGRVTAKFMMFVINTRGDGQQIGSVNQITNELLRNFLRNYTINRPYSIYKMQGFLLRYSCRRVLCSRAPDAYHL